MVWYSHLFKNFPQFVVIHTVKDFSVVSEAEVKFFEIPFLYMCVCVCINIYMKWNEDHSVMSDSVIPWTIQSM